MLKLFSKIRRRLLVQGKTMEYLKYAIGEIILVVVGILIALQINTWNEQRKLRILEKKYLNGFNSDIHSDINSLTNRNEQTRLHMYAAENVLTLLNSKKPFKDIILKWDNGSFKADTLLFLKSLIRAGYLTFPKVNDFTFEDIKSSGNTNIFSDNRTKERIFKYYSNLELYNDWIEQKRVGLLTYQAILSGIIDPELRTLPRLDSLTIVHLMATHTVNVDSTIEVMKSIENFRPVTKAMIYNQKRLLLENKQRKEDANEVLKNLADSAKNGKGHD